MRNYLPNPADRVSPLAAPLKAPDHSGLPPAFIAVAENDPLRDDGIAYAEALRAAGVPVTLDTGKGLIHGYLRSMGYCDDAKSRLRDMCAWLADQNL
jgi:acetyl esterase